MPETFCSQGQCEKKENDAKDATLRSYGEPTNLKYLNKESVDAGGFF